MRTTTCLMTVLLLAIGCGSADDEDRSDRPDPEPQRVSLARATELVRTHVFTKQKPTMNPEAPIPLREITPDDFFERTGWQLFKVTEGPLA